VDLVTVWNEAMKREAIELHGVSARRVVVTGAAAFDHWFDWRPSATREAFCARVGLPPDRPYVLYLCSSSFVAPEEVPFVRRWVEQIRASSLPSVRDAGILVRPHPQNADQWQDVDLSAAGVAIWPRAGAAPVDASTRSEYFDSMYYSSAVVGVNTTAEIESAILRRPVHTVLAPEFRESQEGTLHFGHLQNVNGGVLHVAGDFQEHLAQLDASIRAPEAARDRCRKFVEAFVRPYGLGDPATPRLVDALEALAAAPAPKPDQGPVWAPLIRPWLYRSDEVKRVMWAVLEAKDVRQTAKELRRAKRRALELHEGDSPLDAPEPDAASPPQEREPAAAASDADGARRERLQRLVKEFFRSGEVDRRTFLRNVMDGIPARSFIDIHQATKPRKLDYPHADIYMRVATDAEEYRLRTCSKESFTTEWIQTRIGPGEMFYDIGANVGAFSLVAAKKPSGPARVFAIEPSYATVASLCANIVLNDAAAHITPVPVALSDATTLDVFGLRDLEPGAARHALGSGSTEDGPALYQQPVMVFRLDDLIELFRLPPPNHIKLDVDGSELAVLNGASRTLASPALCSILVEVSTWLSAQVTELLEQHGLRLESKISIKNKAGEYAVWYGLFTRGSAPGMPAASAHQP
jgi:FkbM family methyltransferase